MRFSRTIVTALLLVFSTVVTAQQFDWAPDFPEGSKIPVLEAPDQNGQIMTLDTLSGEKGLVLLFNRSFDWCPWCKAQLVDLTAVADTFSALGFNVATITYDPVETLKEVELDQDVGFPMLYDEAIKHVNAFGILNTDYESGHFAYGVPQPGIMIISPDGTILRKFAEENYRERPDFEVVVDAIRAL